jgi:hypothetical protein
MSLNRVTLSSGIWAMTRNCGTCRPAGSWWRAFQSRPTRRTPTFLSFASLDRLGFGVEFTGIVRG